jgi:hypothetical protein
MEAINNRPGVMEIEGLLMTRYLLSKVSVLI